MSTAAEWHLNTLKLAVATAIIRTRPPDIPTQLWVRSLAESWERRLHRDDRYIRWLELERLQLLHKTARLGISGEEGAAAVTTPGVNVVVPRHIDLTATSLGFLRSTARFLALPALDPATLAATTEDLLLHLRDLLHQPDLFLGPLGAALERCCGAFSGVELGAPNTTHLTALAELLLDFLTVMKSNRPIPGDDQGEGREGGVSPVLSGIRVSLAPPTEKKAVVGCVVALSRNPHLHSAIQRSLLAKILAIVDVLDSALLASNPATLDCLFYLIEGLYLTGQVRVENGELLQKCISSSVARFPLASQFLIVCGLHGPTGGDA